MHYVQEFFDAISSHGGLLFLAFCLIALFVMKLQKVTLPGWNGFLGSLNRPGGHIFVGSFWTIVGIIMLQVMLVDDGKGVIGFGLGILSRSMGTHATFLDEKEIAALLQKYKDTDPAVAAFLAKMEKQTT